MSQVTPVEAKYLVKIFTGEMRTGLHEGLMEQAVARAFDVPLQTVQHAAMVLGDIGEVACNPQNTRVKSHRKSRFHSFSARKAHACADCPVSQRSLNGAWW